MDMLISGCPPLHGKDQLLCPSRNTHRYDVCISQRKQTSASDARPSLDHLEQLCDHVRDCPDGEDEDPSQCFFYKPVRSCTPGPSTPTSLISAGRAVEDALACGASSR